MKKIKNLGNYINGDFYIEPQSELKPQLSPANLIDEVIDFPTNFVSTFNSVDKACKYGKQAHLDWAKMSLAQRKDFLLPLASIFQKRKSELAEVISRETGKPLWESEGEVQGLINKVDIILNSALERIKDQEIESKPDLQARLKFKSRGLFLVIGPFNFPMHLPFSQILPALVAGNTVIFKPSEKTSASGQLLAQCFNELGLPRAVFQMVQGDAGVSKKLTEHALVDGIFFVGSFAVGMKIKKSLIDDYKKILALEMGGYNSTLVWDYKNREHAISETLKSCFLTAGQRCSSTSQILLNKKIAGDFLPHFLKAVQNIKIGNWKQNPFMGSLIDKTSFDAFFDFQKRMQQEGLTILQKGKDLSHLGGHYVSPGIYQMNKSQSLQIGHEETFTPQILVYEVEDTNEALKMINHSGYGLVLSVFTNDKQIKQEMFYGARVGLLNINRSSCGANSKLPFGGLGKSGNDRPAGYFALDSCVTPLAELETEIS